MCRGYYTRAVLAAWNWRDGKLNRVWTFDSDDGTPGNRAYRGQGNHNLSASATSMATARTRSSTGHAAIDHDGKGLYSTGLGHGDAMHLSDIDPDRPGLEVFDIHETTLATPTAPSSAMRRPAELIWGKPSQRRRPGRGHGYRSASSGIRDVGIGLGLDRPVQLPRARRSPIASPARATSASGGTATCCASCSTATGSPSGIGKTARRPCC